MSDLDATFTALIRAAAPTPAPVADVATWTEQTLDGTEVIRTPWVTVTGLDPLTRAELRLSYAETETETQSRTETAPPVASKENPMLAKATLALVATAGAALTVHVVRGRADVQPTDRPAFLLAAGDRATIPRSGAATIVTRPTETAAVGRAAALPPPRATSEPALPEAVEEVCPDKGEGECPCAGIPDCKCVRNGCEPADNQAPPETARVELDLAGAPAMGPANAKVTIVELVDFQCPFCERAVATVHDLAALYPDDVRVVIKHLPLPGHKQARPAAIAAMAAHRQGKFWEMHEMLFANQSKLDADAMRGYARHLGLDLARFERDLADPAIAAQIDADAAEAVDKGFRGVPAFTVNGRTVVGAVPLEVMRGVVEEELSRARARLSP